MFEIIVEQFSKPACNIHKMITFSWLQRRMLNNNNNPGFASNFEHFGIWIGVYDLLMISSCVHKSWWVIEQHILVPIQRVKISSFGAGCKSISNFRTSIPLVMFYHICSPFSQPLHLSSTKIANCCALATTS